MRLKEHQDKRVRGQESKSVRKCARKKISGKSEAAAVAIVAIAANVAAAVAVPALLCIFDFLILTHHSHSTAGQLTDRLVRSLTAGPSLLMALLDASVVCIRPS